MDAALKIITLLPWTDWLALGWFFVGWVAYAVFARRRGQAEGSLLATTNHYRRLWMLQTTGRDVRVIDGIVCIDPAALP